MLMVVTGELPPPRVLGRYALYDKIASGGMATVHLGRLLGPVGFARTVAIKRLHAQFAEDPEFVSMFLDEARMVARISHPNVVPTLDVVATEGELFLVMEYVHGESLARLLRASHAGGTRIPPDMVVTLMVGVLHGLHAAHEARSERGEPLGIVHRDVSPQNILVGIDGAARVLDFGVAKSLGRLQTTREGQLNGKLSYMAPEQIRGKVTRATDVYAASIVLWESLVGQRLFAGENEGQLLDQVQKGCQIPPSLMASGVSPELDAVTLRGLALDPAMRFATAREMARALEDAVPPVAASKIGEWVESLIKEKLWERSERIAAIESSSATTAPVGPPSFGGSHAGPVTAAPAPAPLPPAPPPPLRDAPGGEGGPFPVADDTLPTQLSTGSVSAPGRPPSRFPRRRGARVLAGALAGTVAVSVLVATLIKKSAAGPAAATSTEATAAAVAVPVATVTADQDSSTAPPPPAFDSAGAAPQTSPFVASAAVPAPSAVAVPASPRPTAPPAWQKPAAPAAPSPASRCNPPWYVDGRGVRMFKKECL
jgi:serine/threonine protein kinase